MALIEQKAAIDALCSKGRKAWDTLAVDYVRIIIQADAVEVLMQMPAVDAVPVRHGRWIYGEDEYGIDGYHCNKCGFFVPWDYNHKGIDFIKDYHFCPNCMAKMDGKDKNGGKLEDHAE